MVDFLLERTIVEQFVLVLIIFGGGSVTDFPAHCAQAGTENDGHGRPSHQSPKGAR